MISLSKMAVWIPEEFEDAAHIAKESGLPEFVVEEKMGIKKKCRARKNVNTSTMAINAAKEVLKDIDPKSIDMIIWTGSEFKDHPVWSAGIYVQEQIGAYNAWAFDLSARCSSNVVGLKVAKAMMEQDSSLKKVLLCGGHKTGELVNYKDESSRFLYNLSDGGAAILLERGDFNPLLESSVITDGAFSKDVIIPAGGTVMPWSDKAEDYCLTCPDIAGMRVRLAERSIDNFLKVIKGAATASMPNQPIDYLSLLHMKKSAHDEILSRLELEQDQSIYLNEYGHFGAPDQVLSLGLAEEFLTPGSHVVLASAGIGYTWSAISLRWDQKTFSLIKGDRNE